MPPTGHPDPGPDPGPGPRPAGIGSGRRRLVVAVVAGLALVATLVGLQLADEGDGPARGPATASTPGR